MPRTAKVKPDVCPPAPPSIPLDVLDRLAQVEQDVRTIAAYITERDQLRPNGPWPRITRLAAGG